MTVQELIAELSGIAGSTKIEVTIQIEGLDAERVFTEFTIALQNGRFTMHATS